MSIRRLDRSDAQHISSEQVSVSLVAIVKELVENALDANATSIDVRVVGLSQVVVRDNGCGIGKQNIDKVGLRYHTSKITDDGELADLKTLGFRGEALNSIVNTSREVTIKTRTDDERICSQFQLQSQQPPKPLSQCAGERGTTVTVKDIFYRIPVRKAHAMKSIQTTLKHVTELLHQYAVCNPPVRFHCKLESGAGYQTEWTKPAVKTELDALRELLGPSVLLQLMQVDEMFQLGPSNARVQLTGWVPRPDANLDLVLQSTKHNCYTFLNGRPIDLPFVSDLRSRFFSSRNIAEKKHLVLIMKLNMPRDSFDINVEPNKTIALFHEKDAMKEMFENFADKIYPTQHIQLSPTLVEKQDKLVHSTDAWSRGKGVVQPVIIARPVGRNQPIEGQDVGFRVISKPGPDQTTTISETSFPSRGAKKAHSESVAQPGYRQQRLEEYVTMKQAAPNSKLAGVASEKLKFDVLPMQELSKMYMLWLQNAINTDGSKVFDFKARQQPSGARPVGSTGDGKLHFWLDEASSCIYCFTP